MGERIIHPKFNVHENYKRVNIINPYRFDSGGGSVYSYLLDEFPDTGNNGLFYDYFKLSSSYTGACIRIRRSSDNTQQDIGFDGNYIDKAAITSFVGAGSGFVVTKYSQNGNGRNITNTTAAEQPRIVNAGVLNELNGFVFEENFSSAQRLSLSVLNNIVDITVFQVFAHPVIDAIFAGIVGSSPYFGIMDSGSTSVADFRFGFPVYYKNGTLINTPTRGVLSTNFAIDSLVLLSATGVEHGGFGPYSTRYTSTGFPAVKKDFARINYGINRNADRAAIESLINGNYNIY